MATQTQIKTTPPGAPNAAGLGTGDSGGFHRIRSPSLDFEMYSSTTHAAMSPVNWSVTDPLNFGDDMDTKTMLDRAALDPDDVEADADYVPHSSTSAGHSSPGPSSPAVSSSQFPSSKPIFIF